VLDGVRYLLVARRRVLLEELTATATKQMTVYRGRFRSLRTTAIM
jgi:hypothetical protein